MYIFAASLRTWLPTFVYLISENHKIDFYGCNSNLSYNNNVNYFGSCFKKRNELILFLKNNWKKYDLIIMPDFDWQIDPDFQILKKIIKTPILSPSVEATQLEGNKIFFKKLLKQLNIPTPEYSLYESVEKVESLNKKKFVFKLAVPLIHSGYQTRIFSDDSYKKIIPQYFEKGYRGEAYIEEFVEGKEAVLHFLCNGKENLYLGSSRDYKKISDGDGGINISSAGSYSNVDYVLPEIIQKVKKYLKKIQSYIDYVGIMCVGIIIYNNDLTILEINVRPGVPEFNTLLLTLDTDLLVKNLYLAAIRKKLLPMRPLLLSATTVQVFHKNYSWESNPNSEIPEKILLNDLIVTYFEPEFHQFNYFISISSTGEDRKKVSDNIYQQIKNIDFKDYKFRSDIGYLE
jgi:phosphoribosylamine-glycine ligase